MKVYAVKKLGLALSFWLVLAACGGGDGGDGEASTSEANSEASSTNTSTVAASLAGKLALALIDEGTKKSTSGAGLALTETKDDKAKPNCAVFGEDLTEKLKEAATKALDEALEKTEETSTGLAEETADAADAKKTDNTSGDGNKGKVLVEDAKRAAEAVAAAVKEVVNENDVKVQAARCMTGLTMKVTAKAEFKAYRPDKVDKDFLSQLQGATAASESSMVEGALKDEDLAAFAKISAQLGLEFAADWVDPDAPADEKKPFLRTLMPLPFSKQKAILKVGKPRLW